MSTDRSKKKRRFPRIERIKIIEYGLIALVVLVFIGLAILYGTRDPKQDADETAVPTATPVPTEDPSIRGMNVLDALAEAGFSITYLEDARYDVRSSDGVFFEMRMVSDDRGVKTLSFETILCPDTEEDTDYARILQEENSRTLAALQRLFDSVLPVFRRPAADSDTIVKQCRKVVNSLEPYAKHLTRYSVRITSDPETVPQTVLITLIRDS
jgi:hypothetical protein